MCYKEDGLMLLYMPPQLQAKKKDHLRVSRCNNNWTYYIEAKYGEK
jgi:hypothetical protein